MTTALAKSVTVALAVAAACLLYREASAQDASREAPPADEKACVARKGVWLSNFGLERPRAKKFCVLPAKDAGKVCNASSECSLFCQEDLSGKRSCAAFYFGEVPLDIIRAQGVHGARTEE